MGKKWQNRTLAYRSHLVLAMTLMLCMLSSASADEPVTIIRGGDLYTITSGIIRNGPILIEDGKISRIGQNIDIQKDAKVVDASGKVVMPGLIAATASGVTGYGGGKIGDSLDPYNYRMSLALASGITTMFLSTGNTNAVIKTTYGDLDGMLVKEPAVENVSFSRSQWLSKTDFVQNLRKAKAYLQKLDEYQRAKDKKKLQEPKKPSGIDKHIRLLKGQMPARLDASTASSATFSALARSASMRVSFSSSSGSAAFLAAISASF